MANQIMEDYKDEEIVVLSVLKGGVFFTTDLAKHLKNNTSIEFVRLSSYGKETESTGDVKLTRKYFRKYRRKKYFSYRRYC